MGLLTLLICGLCLVSFELVGCVMCFLVVLHLLLLALLAGWFVCGLRFGFGCFVFVVWFGWFPRFWVCVAWASGCARDAAISLFMVWCWFALLLLVLLFWFWVLAFAFGWFSGGLVGWVIWAGACWFAAVGSGSVVSGLWFAFGFAGYCFWWVILVGTFGFLGSGCIGGGFRFSRFWAVWLFGLFAVV